MNTDFSAHFGEVFTIQVLQWPESIKLQLFETKLLSSNIIAEVYLPIPDVQHTTKSLTCADQYFFTSEKKVTCPHAAVGSGLCYPCTCGIFGFMVSILLGVAGLLTTGSISAAVCWGVDDIGNILCPPDSKNGG